MTTDALVNLFIEHNKPTESPPGNTESQREQHFTASSPHPVPNVSVPFHQSPRTAVPSVSDRIEQPTIGRETDFHDAEVPVVDRCMDLDLFSPPPQSPLAATECAFCGTAGTPRTCGALVAVQLGDQNVAVHHACALWAPQDCDEYLNLESEWRHSQNRRCLVCNSHGAAVTCTYAGCRAAYHLPCAAITRRVTLNKSSFELWCPKHVQSYDHNREEDECATGRVASRQYHSHRASGSAAGLDDEEFSPGQSGARPRRNAALSRKHRFQRHVDGAPISSASVVAATAAAAVAVSDRTQRPRTDWQRQGDAWVKVVPPWWCEHRTIHFANKVFRELFCGHTSAFLVDADGTEWDCLVSCETRNDMRLQYTLRGQFQDYWDSAGVKSGDVLTFQRNTPTVGKITVGRYPQGRGLEAAFEPAGAGSCSNNTTVSKESIYAAAAASKASVPLPLSNLGAHSNGITKNTGGTGGSLRLKEQQPRQQQKQQHPDVETGGSANAGRPNRWTELPDGSVAKHVYKSTISHQQCPIAGWLYRKLYDRAPADTDTAPMRDPALATDFVFEVAFVPAANVHYISGRSFGAWMKAAGVQSGDQVRVWRDKTGVKICRMANEKSNSRVGEGTVLPEEHIIVATAGVALLPQMERFTSPPGVDALAALNALAAAAGYAGQHGTPAIDAVLSHAADLRKLVTSGEQEVHALLSIGNALNARLAADGMPLPPSPFLSSAGAGGFGSEKKKRKNENLGVGSVSKQPRKDNSIDSNSALLPIPSPALPARPTSPSAVPGPSTQPDRIQLQQALQQLVRHYQTQMHQQQQNTNSITAASKHAPPPVLLHRAPPTTIPHSTTTPNQQYQQQSTPSPPSFAAVTTALGLHQWSSIETALIAQFRATCGGLDSTGRNIAFTNVLQLQHNKEALLGMIRGVVLGNDRGTRFGTAVSGSGAVKIVGAAEPARQLEER